MRPTGAPLYQQIAKILQEEIENNHLPGDRLESEGRIADRFKVNRHTLRRAIDELVNRGLLERRRGLGVFVFERPLKYALFSETRITTNFAKMGVVGVRSFYRRNIVPATREVAEFLHIRKGQKVASLDALVLADKKPFCVSTHYFGHASYGQIYEAFDQGSLHEFLDKTYAVKLKRKCSFITALLPTEDDAALLRISLSHPILRIRSVNINTVTADPVEYVVSRYRADRVEMTIDF
jgi:GntR family phosphonate transport system transcriptional regulator